MRARTYFTRYGGSFHIAKLMDLPCICLDNRHQGWIAENLVATVKAHGGILTLEDMKRYQAKVEPALIGTYRGRKIITSPLPTRYAIGLLGRFGTSIDV